MTDFLEYKTHLQVESTTPLHELVPRLADKFRFYNTETLAIENDSITFTNGMLAFMLGNSPFARFASGTITLTKRDDTIVEVEAKVSLLTLVIIWTLFIVIVFLFSLRQKAFLLAPSLFVMLAINGLLLIIRFRWFLKRSIKNIVKEIEKERMQNEALYHVPDNQKEWIADPAKCPACGLSIKTTDTTCPDCGLHF